MGFFVGLPTPLQDVLNEIWTDEMGGEKGGDTGRKLKVMGRNEQSVNCCVKTSEGASI